MLILALHIGQERYGIAAADVVEVVPCINLKKVPLTEACIRGLFNYRGEPTPVIDLCQLFESRDCKHSLSSRIIIIKYRTQTDTLQTIGLIAEKVTDVMQCDADEMVDNGIHKENSDFLGKIYRHQNEMIQLIDIDKVLPESISQQLSGSA